MRRFRLLVLRCCFAWIGVCLGAHGQPASPASAPVAATGSAAPVEAGDLSETVTLGGEIFRLELALTAASRERGLMGRAQIPPDGGMLFVFPGERVLRFWPAYTLTDLDILFLDSRGRITAMHTMRREPPRGATESEEEYCARLPLYPSAAPAVFAIELAAGTLPCLDLTVGRKVPLDIERLRKLAR